MSYSQSKEMFVRVVLVFVAGVVLFGDSVFGGRVEDLEIYLLPHSHVDIGYTKLQTEVEKDHWGFYEAWIEKAKQTEGYPEGARFKGNVEVLWAVESYLRESSADKREAFIEAAKKGWIGLDGMYCTELTALCREEELGKLVDYGNYLRREYDVHIDAAMITDVPGCTWGMVPVLAQNGIRYLSLGPNSEHRIGHVRSAWDGKPFYWVSPCGRYKVLCWQTTNSYHPAFRDEEGLKKFVEEFKKEGASYPYDVIYFRQSMGDNEALPMGLPEFVRDWNSKHEYPRLVIATTSEAFRALERRYGDVLPCFSGDLTPYWEDGAGSSALETAMNRATAERLVQADAVMAMRGVEDYPAEEFGEAWQNVLLYDEHTWGARSYVNSSMHCWPPGSEGYKAQWKIKRGFAVDADAQSRELLDRALSGGGKKSAAVGAVDVVNTSSWVRTDIVVLPAGMKPRGERVRDGEGKIVPSQRLSDGRLAFLAEGVGVFASKRYFFEGGRAGGKPGVRVEGNGLSNDLLELKIDRGTGAICSLKWKKPGVELVNDKWGMGLNEYYYVDGYDPKNLKANGKVDISAKERGPLVASVVIESDVPGCRNLSREVRLIAGIERVDIMNVMDKEEIPIADLVRKPEPRKEGVYFGFDFGVAEGVVRMDIPWAVVRAEADQLAGSCKNFFTVQRWVDISNQDYGVTWATVDAPLITLGEIPLQPRDPYMQVTDEGELIWKKRLEPTQRLYSYVMNNYWTTNYRHAQGGVTIFRYSIRPHGLFDGGEAARFGRECSQPLLVIGADEGRKMKSPLAGVKPCNIVVTALKWSRDGKGLIVRLFNAGGGPERPLLKWAEGVGDSVYLSNFAEEEVRRVKEVPEMAGYEILTLRVSTERR